MVPMAVVASNPVFNLESDLSGQPRRFGDVWIQGGAVQIAGIEYAVIVPKHSFCDGTHKPNDFKLVQVKVQLGKIRVLGTSKQKLMGQFSVEMRAWQTQNAPKKHKHKDIIYKGGHDSHESYGRKRKKQGGKKCQEKMEGSNFHLQGQQQLDSSTRVHTALGFLVMMLLTLIQVRFQNSDNPFHTNGGIMFSFIGCAFGYSITLVWISQPTLNTSYPHIGRSVCVILGTSASGLLVEILLPPLGFFILAICALMFAQLLRVSHQEILQCFQEIFQSINQYTSEAFKTLRGWVQNGFQSLKQAASRAFNSSSMPTANSLEEQAETVGTSA